MRILISGAGVAGLSSALALGASGHDITIIERANEFRTKGAPIDIRGDAIAACAQMGILQKLKTREVSMSQGGRIIDRDGTPVAELGGETFPDAEDDIEVPREDVCHVLQDALDSSTSLTFGDSIQTLAENDSGVDVTFTSGNSGRFDIVVGADGLHSLTRQLTFGPEQGFLHHLGFYSGYTWLTSGITTEDGASILNWPGHQIGVATYNHTSLAYLVFRSPWIDYDYHNIDEQRQILLDAFADHSEWRVPEILGNIRHDPNLYFDSVSQINMDTWHKGRVVLVGDAAHCASALSGRGTSLALTGASYLARALHEYPENLNAAFTQYTADQHPHVTYAQAIAEGGGDLLIPATQTGIDDRNKQFSLANR